MTDASTHSLPAPVAAMLDSCGMAMKKDSDARQGTLADLWLKPAASKRVRAAAEPEAPVAAALVAR